MSIDWLTLLCWKYYQMLYLNECCRELTEKIETRFLLRYLPKKENFQLFVKYYQPKWQWLNMQLNYAHRNSVFWLKFIFVCIYNIWRVMMSWNRVKRASLGFWWMDTLWICKHLFCFSFMNLERFWWKRKWCSLTKATESGLKWTNVWGRECHAEVLDVRSKCARWEARVP